MIGLLQRVSRAAVRVDSAEVARIDTGLLVLVAVERGDSLREADRLAERVTTYRVFPDAEGRMNRSLEDVGGALLAVPQFTLAADTRKGTRPGFSHAADPAEGERLFAAFVACARRRIPATQAGTFGATMQVELVNDGPVTISLQVAPAS